MVRAWKWAMILVVTLGGCANTQKAHYKVADNTAWLEEVEGERALNFVRQENARSQGRLEQDPRFRGFEKSFLDILTAKDRIVYVWVKGQDAYNFWQDEKSVRGHLRRSALNDYLKGRPRWQIVLDVDDLAKKENENWVWGGIQCLPNLGTRCLVQLSRGGKDADVVREFDLVTGQFIAAGFQIPEAKTDVAWIDENTIFVSTDFGPGTLTESGYPRQTRVWRRGEDLLKSALLFESKASDLASSGVVFHGPDAREMFVSRRIDFYSQELFRVADDFKSIEPLKLPKDLEIQGVFAGHLIVTVRSDWQRFSAGEVIALDIAHWRMTGQWDRADSLYKASPEEAFLDIQVTRDRLILSHLHNVQSRIRVYRFSEGEWFFDILPTQQDSVVYISGTDRFRRDFFLRREGFIQPTSLSYFENSQAKERSIQTLPARFNAKGLSVSQNWTESRDGTRIPYFVVGPKVQKPLPTILSAYGGFEIANLPYYSGGIGKVWLEAGQRYVVANIRGGGEFGPRWHQAGLKENRQRVFDDFFAVAEDLLRRGLTTQKQLGAIGGSNGGLLMGVALTQRPDLFSAIDCQVPLLDMLNYHKWLAGASWMGEYGNPEEPAMREVLKKYSPLHNLKQEQSYPEILFVTSTKDDRVHPAHARKMAFALKEMNKPFLYYENIEGGHGAAANLKQRAYKSALEFTYFYQKLVD